MGTGSAVLTGSLGYLLPTNLILEQTTRFELARANRSLDPILAHAFFTMVLGLNSMQKSRTHCWAFLERPVN